MAIIDTPLKIVKNIQKYDSYRAEPVWRPKDQNTSTYYNYRVDSQATVPLRSNIRTNK